MTNDLDKMCEDVGLTPELREFKDKFNPLQLMAAMRNLGLPKETALNFAQQYEANLYSQVIEGHAKYQRLQSTIKPVSFIEDIAMCVSQGKKAEYDTLFDCVTCPGVPPNTCPNYIPKGDYLKHD